jgi:hypothetical protein
MLLMQACPLAQDPQSTVPPQLSPMLPQYWVPPAKHAAAVARTQPSP